MVKRGRRGGRGDALGRILADDDVSTAGGYYRQFLLEQGNELIKGRSLRNRRASKMFKSSYNSGS